MSPVDESDSTIKVEFFNVLKKQILYECEKQKLYPVCYDVKSCILLYCNRGTKWHDKCTNEE